MVRASVTARSLVARRVQDARREPAIVDRAREEHRADPGREDAGRAALRRGGGAPESLGDLLEHRVDLAGEATPHRARAARDLAGQAPGGAEAGRARAEKLGGRVLVPRIEVPEVGTIAVIADPTGAVLGLFEPAPSL